MATEKEGLFFISFEDITGRKERELLIEEAKGLPAAMFYFERLAFLWINDQNARNATKKMIEERQKKEVRQGQGELQDFLLILCEEKKEKF